MRLEEFDYALPADRIAQVPIEPATRRACWSTRGARRPSTAPSPTCRLAAAPGDVVVVNDTKVIPARLRLHRETGGAAEVLLLEPQDPGRRHWEALVRPARKLRDGEELFTADGRPVIVVGVRTLAGDTFHVELTGPVEALALLDEIGEMPLPPYIHERLDRPDRYQTVYAATPGSAAAPTAGLHLTPQVLDGIGRAGAAVHHVELVVGLDTFQPVGEDDPLQHRMHTERYRVPETTWAACQQATRVVAIGTTSVRALGAPAVTGRLSGRTDLFLHRGSDFQVVDVLMTNFHLPRTTLLMMIDAFVGPRWRDLYATRWPTATASCPSATRCCSTTRPGRFRALHPVTMQLEATDGAARAGVATTAAGTFRTPCFMPVGTRGAVKYLSAADYEALGVEIVLGNTYHLMLRPGAETVARFGGLGAFAGWDGLTLTDSGGYQVFSLDPKVDDDGVTFRSVYDGSTHRLTPERAVAIQELIGADVQMVLDVCPPLPSPPPVIDLAVARTAAWAGRARAAHRRDDQALFGIVQGGIDESRRAESAKRTADLDFDGYGIGGFSVGEDTRRDAAGTRRNDRPCRPTVPATSWGSAIRPRSSRRWRSVSTSSTASCRPVSDATGRRSRPTVASP